MFVLCFCWRISMGTTAVENHEHHMDLCTLLELVVRIL